MIISEICKNYLSESKPEEKDSPEFCEQSEKCIKVYDELYKTLNEAQKKKLVNLDLEYFLLAGIGQDDGFKEGSETGFKLAVRLLLGSLSDKILF